MAFRCLLLWFLLGAGDLQAFTANKVWFDFLDDGRYRVTAVYTIPALKEFRESYVIFAKKKEAETFYWALVQGADFYPDDPKKLRFIPPKDQPAPW